MDNRALKIAFSYINSKVEDSGSFDEKKVRDLSRDALKSFYPTFLHAYLRNLDVNQIIELMYFITKQFGDTAPQAELHKILTPLKIKILNSIGDSALLEDGSLLDRVVSYFRENPTNSEDEITQYVQKLLGVIKQNTKRTAPKIQRIIDQY